MEITVHSVLDHSTGKQIWFGIGDKGYDKAMEWCNQHPDNRYEYFGNDEDLDFVFRQTDEGLRKILHDVQDTDVFGAFHVGKILVEFRCNGGGYDPDYHDCTNDVYVYGEHDDNEWFVHNVPYAYVEDEIVVPKRRTLVGFKRACMQNMINFLNKHPELIRYAIQGTVVDEWY